MNGMTFANNKKKVVEHKMCSLIYLKLQSETFLNLSRIQRDIVITVNWSSSKVPVKRLRGSTGSVLAFGTQVRGFKPDRSRWIFQGEKILSTPSFGGGVTPSVPYRRFTACKRPLNVVWKSGIFRQNSSAISRPCSSTFG